MGNAHPSKLSKVSCCGISTSLLGELEKIYDDFFSFEKGIWYVHLIVVLEVIEVVNQSIQLASFPSSGRLSGF